MNQKEEIQLVSLCKKNNREAQEKLYNSFSDYLFAVCLRYCADRDQAKDCLHDSFLKIFTKIDQYKTGNLKAWMATITVNTCLQQLKKDKLTTPLLLEYEKSLSEDNDDTEFNLQMNQIQTEILFDAIRKLPTQYRLVFNMFYIDGYSHKEIASFLSISEGTSKSNLFKARKILQRELSKLLNVRHG